MQHKTNNPTLLRSQQNKNSTAHACDSARARATAVRDVERRNELGVSSVVLDVFLRVLQGEQHVHIRKKIGRI